MKTLKHCEYCGDIVIYCPFCGHRYRLVVPDTTSWGSCKYLCDNCGSVGIIDHYSDFEHVPPDIKCYKPEREISEDIKRIDEES